MKRLRLTTILFTALLGMLSQPANAILVDQGNTVLDTQSNMLWLDVSQTSGMSYGDAGAAFAADGWGYATEAQYEAMFDSFFPGYVDNSGTGRGRMRILPGDDLYSQALLFGELFGLTADGGSSFNSYGWYEDSTGILRLGGVYANVNYADLYRDLISDYEAYRNSGLPSVGVFLVKSASVPEPGSLLLLGLGLAGLGFYRRKIR